MQINYTAKFIRQYSKLDFDLKKELKEKVNLFLDIRNHKQLKIHKLHGKLKSVYGFSINYKIRIVFKYLSKQEAVFLVVGDHDVYK